jgi:hypothetical protein
MGCRKEHIKHTKENYPEFDEEEIDSVHKWMDHPSTWTHKPYESGYKRKKCYNSKHRVIRHDPEKVANALSGKGKEKNDKWHRVYKIAEDHCKLDGLIKDEDE